MWRTAGRRGLGREGRRAGATVRPALLTWRLLVPRNSHRCTWTCGSLSWRPRDQAPGDPCLLLSPQRIQSTWSLTWWASASGTMLYRMTWTKSAMTDFSYHRKYAKHFESPQNTTGSLTPKAIFNHSREANKISQTNISNLTGNILLLMPGRLESSSSPDWLLESSVTSLMPCSPPFAIFDADFNIPCASCYETLYLKS